MTSIPVVDLPAQYQALRPGLEPVRQSVLERGAFILAPSTTIFR